MKLRAHSTIILAILMLFFAALPASGSSLLTSTEREQIYSAAVQNLEAYIESYGQSAASLTGIEETFASLGRYEQSPSLMSYTRILAKLEADEYDYDLLLQLEMLDKDVKFKTYLNDVLKGSAIGSVEELTVYAAGREYEYNQQPELAIDEYAKCMSFFDAKKRYGALKSGQDKAAYETAAALWDNGDFAGAYYAFGRTSRYQDSEQRRTGIISLLGYTPISEDDNPEPVTNLQSNCTATSVSLKWNAAKHATGYKITMQQTGEKSSTTVECTTAGYTWTGLNPDTRYLFSVAAVAGKVELEPVVITIRTEKKGVSINENRFPDGNFREYVQDNFDKDHDGILSEPESMDVISIDVQNKAIKSLVGIEHFKELECLICSSNQLTSLNVSSNTFLRELFCDHNQLTSLDVSNNTALTELLCDNNQLTSLDVSRNTALTDLDCSENQLTSLDVSRNTALTNLSCSENQLTSLDVTRNTALTHLHCYKNRLTSLDVRKNIALEILSCFSNHLTSLDVSRNTALTTLWCQENQFTSLDLRNNRLLNKYNVNFGVKTLR